MPAEDRAPQQQEAVIWLDDLEGYLGPDGLTSDLLARLMNRRAIVLATLRDGFYESYRGRAERVAATAGDDRQRVAAHNGVQVLNQANWMELDRHWSEPELERAAASSDPRVIEAADRHGPFGIAEYLAAGPDLWQEWRAAAHVGGHPRGTALVAASVDLSRVAGSVYATREVIEHLHEHYLNAAGGALTRPEPLDEAWAWATATRYGFTSLLVPEASGQGWRAFDYLADNADRDAAVPPVPDMIWEYAVTHAPAATDLFLIGVRAYPQHPEIAVKAMRPMANQGDAEVNYLLAEVLSESGDAEALLEAENRYRSAADDGQKLAPYNLANLLSRQGRLQEAERWYKRAIELDDFDALVNLGNDLAEQDGRAAEAEDYYRRAIARHDVKGYYNLAVLLSHEEGRAAEAEQLYIAAATAGHPKAAYNLGFLLLEQGRDAEAEQWYRSALDAGDFRVHVALGALLTQDDRADEAIPYLRAAADADIVEGMFDCWQVLGRRAETVEEARRYLRAGSRRRVSRGDDRTRHRAPREWLSRGGHSVPDTGRRGWCC